MKHLRKLLICLLTFLLTISSFQMTTSAEDEIDQATAATMRMRKIEGTVRASDKNGKSISVFQDMKLYDGYNIETLKNGYAWIELDSTKLIKLDAESRTVIQKSGKEMDIILKKGKLFFNVAQPLEEDESFYIRTSTTMVGIRGTCGWVEIVDKNTTRVYILEGSVQVAVIDPVSREVKVDSVSGGDNVTCVVYGQTKPDDKCDIIRDRFSEEDVPGFVVVELVGDMKHVDEIFDRSKTDVDLRRLTKPAAKKRLQDDQKAADNEMRESNAGNVSESPVTSASSGTSAPGASETPAGSETQTFTVTFDSRGGSSVDAQNIAAGNKAAKPADPSKTDREFAGWYTDSRYTAKWNYNNDRVQDNITLFARWIPMSSSYKGLTGMLTWSLDDTGTLIISGNGDMPDYNDPDSYSSGYAPWHGMNIINVVAENGVLSIGECAFVSLINLESVTIPKSVTIIGNRAFRGCNNLESVTIPKNVTRIGTGAFRSCSSLKSVTIPERVTMIDGGAFSYCINLESVIIPKNVTIIGGGAFYECNILNSSNVYFGGTEEEWTRLLSQTQNRYTYLPSTLSSGNYNYPYPAQTSVALSEDPESGETLLEMEEMSEKAVEFQEVKNALENEEAAVESKESIEETDAESAATEVNENETPALEETTSEESASAEEASVETQEMTESGMSETPEGEF